MTDNHAQHVLNHLQQHIEQHGPLTFADYMQQVLYTPNIGYYQTRTQLLGQQGDFVTAPEISPLFGQCIAQQAAQVLTHCGKEASILEFGPGRGILARDILLHLHTHELPLPNTYYLLDISSQLRDIQQQTLSVLPADILKRIKWLDQLPQQAFSGLVIANEVLDAMPVHQFIWQDDQCLERCIGWNNGPNWQTQAATTQLLQAVQAIQSNWPNHYQSEINLWLNGWLSSLNHHWQNGVFLAIDYGFPQHEYYHPSRNQGTVMCHSQQRSHPDPLYRPGLEDITSHVDFTHVAQCAAALDLEVLGFTSQAYFLLNCGLTDLLSTADIQTNQHVKTLTSPHEMGELFKVLAIGKNWPDQSLLGFQQWDQLARL